MKSPENFPVSEESSPEKEERMPVTMDFDMPELSEKELGDLASGKVIESGRPAGRPFDVMVGGERVARAELVVVGDRFGLRIVEVDRSEKKKVSLSLDMPRMTAREVSELEPGKVIESDHSSGDPYYLMVDGKRVAGGEVVVVGDRYGLRITEVNPKS